MVTLSPPPDDLHLLLVLIDDQCTQSMITGVIYSWYTPATGHRRQHRNWSTGRLRGLEDSSIVGVEDAGEAVRAGSERAETEVSAVATKVTGGHLTDLRAPCRYEASWPPRRLGFSTAQDVHCARALPATAREKVTGIFAIDSDFSRVSP